MRKEAGRKKNSANLLNGKSLPLSREHIKVEFEATAKELKKKGIPWERHLREEYARQHGLQPQQVERILNRTENLRKRKVAPTASELAVLKQILNETTTPSNTGLG